MTHRLATMFALASLAAACQMPPSTTNQPAYAHANYQAAPTTTRAITINGAPLSPRGAQVLADLERRQGNVLPDGDYWYDRVSGAAGKWGGPTAGFLPANLELGPPLPHHASGGRSGVVINNRDLHSEEVAWLTNLLGYPPVRGRYWLDANGNVGVEGGRALGNLVALANQRSRAQGGQSGHWGVYQRGTGGGTGIGVAGDGQTTCVNTAEYTRCY